MQSFRYTQILMKKKRFLKIKLNDDGVPVLIFQCVSHLLVRQVEQKLPVKASRSPECRVDRVKSVCSTNDHYLPTTVQAVHQG